MKRTIVALAVVVALLGMTAPVMGAEPFYGKAIGFSSVSVKPFSPTKNTVYGVSKFTGLNFIYFNGQWVLPAYAFDGNKFSPVWLYYSDIKPLYDYLQNNAFDGNWIAWKWTGNNAVSPNKTEITNLENNADSIDWNQFTNNNVWLYTYFSPGK